MWPPQAIRVDASGRALDDARTRALLRRAALFACACLLGAIALIAIVLLLLSRAPGDRLASSGARTTGVVERVDSARKGPNAITVRYRAPGPRIERVIADPFHGRHYERGQRVAVLYDPEDPGTVTIAGEHNMGLLTWLAMLYLGTVAGVLVASVLVLIPRWLRWRWLLSRAAWREFDATAMPTAFGATTALAALVAVGDPASPPQLLYLQWMRNRRAFRPFKERVWVAGEGHRVVVATLGRHGVRDLYAARRPRTNRQRRRWQRSLPADLAGRVSWDDGLQ